MGGGPGTGDSLIAAYPEHGEAQKLGPFIRDKQLPEWRRRFEKTWWQKLLDGALKGDGSGEVEGTPEEERYTWFFQGYWKYRDHAVTRYDGLAPETTDELVRRGWAYIQFISGGDVVLRGPFVLGEDGYFQFGPEDFSENQLAVIPFVVLYGQFPTYQWPQLYVMETDSSPAYKVYSPSQTVYPGNANLGSCFPDPAHPVRDEVLNIFDRLVEAWQRIPAALPPQNVRLWAIWKAGDTLSTGYQPLTRRIRLNGAGESSAEWSDDTIFHEFGHFVFDTYGTDVTSGGGHAWWQSYPQNPALALSEGWAHFYQGFVNHEIGVPAWHEGYHLRPLGGLGGTQTAWAEIENPWHFGSGTSPASGTLQHGLYNEASVAGCLWDMFDAANEVYDGASCSQHADAYADALTRPIGEIWNSVMAGEPGTLLGVLETWYANAYGHQAQICGICNHHGIARWLWMPTERIVTCAILDDTTSLRLALHNTDGTAAHSFSMSTDVAWAWPDVGSGSIDPGDSAVAQLWLDGIGWPPTEVREGFLTINDGSGGCGLEVILRVMGTWEEIEIIAGRVADADGWVEDATVGTDSSGEAAATDGAGWFLLGVPEGVYTLRVWAAGYYPAMLPDVACPSDVGTVVLTPHGTPGGSSLVCTFQGSASTFQGRALLEGDVVEAWDPDGVRCGAWEVTSQGCYGPMVVYGDDPSTPLVDEGAEEGETVRFTINGFTAQCLGPDEPQWHAGGGPYRVELTAHDAPPMGVTDLAVSAVSGLALLAWTAVTEDTSGNPEPSIRTCIHRRPVAYFAPGEATEIDWIFGESEYWDWESGVGDPAVHSFYRIVHRDNLGQSSAPSNTAGEFEFGTGGALLKHEAEERPARLE
ncbi:carboxypeptidase regulatory-like domain-containing protein [Candidatus Fermentibacteria bacterium]|nr:carboxypeptidase regulatory-like domain-containing protein [Candidatus Fermentibacteria bacterium]